MVNLTNITMRYGERVLYRNSDCIIRPGDKIGLVGPNGSGKTTVFRIIAGLEHPDEGNVAIDAGTVIGYFAQDVGDMSGRSALHEVMAGAGRVHDLGEELSVLEHKMADASLPADEMERVIERFGVVQAAYQHAGGYEVETRAKVILAGLGIGDDRSGEPVESFSGGWKMRIALARILLLAPDVLLMDEPTNHLDIESILWLEDWLRNFKGALFMTCHDREFMNRLCTRTIEVAAKTITTYGGDYDFYMREREVRRTQLMSAYKRQQDMLAKEEEFIAKFAARASHAAQVQSRVKMIEKIERIEIPPGQKRIHFEFAPSQRSGDIVVSMDGLAKSWPLPDGKVRPVFSGITAQVKRLNKIAVTGVNGAGKSTLLKVIAEQTEPTAGMCTLGASVKLGYFSQYSSDILDPNRTVIEEVSSHLNTQTVGYIKNLLGAFLFSGDDVEKKISVLSGGEKTRVMLALLLAEPLNFLILDEPTNHLDIESREILLNALKEFDGTVMIVSHDRYFLRHIVDTVFEIDHGAMRRYDGDYTYYLEKKAEMAGSAHEAGDITPRRY